MFLKILLAFAVASPVFAGEYAVLSTGFRIHADRHELEGSSVKLFTEDGVIEVPASSVTSFEAEEMLQPRRSLSPSPPRFPPRPSPLT